MTTTVEGLNTQFEVLANVLNKNIVIDNPIGLEKCLEGLSFYLKKLSLSLNVDLTISSSLCSLCSNPIRKIHKDDSFLLTCGHIICTTDCIKIFVNTTNQYLTDYENSRCPAKDCNKFIPAFIIEEAFGGKDTFAKVLSEYEENRAAKFDCLMCYGAYRVDISITLDCDHRYCRDCISAFISGCISDNKVSESELACPMCAQPINIIIVKELVSRKEFDKLEKFLIRNYKPEVDENTVYFKCDGLDCEFVAFADTKLEEIKCQRCGK